MACVGIPFEPLGHVVHGGGRKADRGQNSVRWTHFLNRRHRKTTVATNVDSWS